MNYISCNVVWLRRTEPRKLVQPSTSIGKPRATYLEFSELAISAAKSRPPQSPTLLNLPWTSRGHIWLIVQCFAKLACEGFSRARDSMPKRSVAGGGGHGHPKDPFRIATGTHTLTPFRKHTFHASYSSDAEVSGWLRAPP